jgi:soluble lytic murein transglycosylase
VTRQVHRIRGLVIAVLLVLLVAMGVEWLAPPWWRKLSNPLGFTKEIAAASKRYHVDPYLITAVIRAESSFDPDVRSNKGALGLMQVMPSTAEYVVRRRGWGASGMNLRKPKSNIDIGTYYLKYLIDKYGVLEYSLAAYNGGEANMDKWLKRAGSRRRARVLASIPYPETRAFVRKVLETRDTYRALYPRAFADVR